MHFSQVLLRSLIPFLLIQTVIPQELPFEIPVQLIGFPIIILAVRLSNFLKKLSYAVNPSTYRSRARRGSEHSPPAIDIAEIEKKLVQEMGDKVCVYEDVCQEYADKVNHDQNFILDWQDIFRHYEKSPRGKKEFYLLSVFMGDIVKSRELCTLLAKRGRSCSDNQKQNVFGINQNQTESKNVVIGNHHIASHHLQQPIHHSQSIHQSNHQRPHVHQQVHRHHVEVHYDPDHPVFGQHPPHGIHYQSRRVIHQ